MMTKLKQRVLRFVKDEQGATAIEYSIMAAAIAAVVVTIVITIGEKVDGMFDDVDQAFS